MESMKHAESCRFEIQDPVHGNVACAALLPSAQPTTPMPLCLFLYGGGGSRESLVEMQPLFAEWWASGLLPPMVIATPEVGPWSFYLGFESFLGKRFADHLRGRFALENKTGVVGISMGGYGALEIAFMHPHERSPPSLPFRR
jgi:dipeptidyl aminopeptidase/acylaminoacyl peptidase